MVATARDDVRVSGAADARPLVLVHGFGCDQEMWRHVVPDLATDHRVVTFDLVGFGRSDVRAYDRERYGTLHGHAADVVALCRELELRDVVRVGHSVSAIIAVLAQQQAPELFGALVLIEDGFVSGPAAQQRWRRALRGVPVGWVGVRCDPAVAAERERARGDRSEGMARLQAESVHAGIAYDLEVDTSHRDPAEVADEVLRHWFG